MITIGVDFSKRTSSYHVLDEKGQTLKRCTLENKPELIADFFSKLPDEPKQLTLEATRNWGLYYEAVKSSVDVFHLAHPKKMRIITESQTKNDPKDAEMIARLTHSGFLPKAYTCPADTRQLRSLLRLRHFLVKQRKAIRNQVQILVDRNLWPCQRPTSFKSLFCQRGLKWLMSLDLCDREMFILKQLLQSFQDMSRRIHDLERFIESQAGDFPGAKYLKTVPGFKNSKVHIYIVLLEIDNIDRFKKSRHFAHYAGLIPSERSSGDKHRTGHLVRDANVFLRTAITESTLSALRADRGLRTYYQSVKERAGSGAAIIASARKLSYAIYHCLKHKRAYYPFTEINKPLPVAA